MVRLLFLGLWSLLGASGAVLVLLSGVRLCLFLRRLFLRGFWRFVPHGSKNKIHQKRRQPHRRDLFVLIRRVANGAHHRDPKRRSVRLGSRRSSQTKFRPRARRHTRPRIGGSTTTSARTIDQETKLFSGKTWQEVRF